MIQDISPKVFLNTYQEKTPTPTSIALIYQNNEILLVKSKDTWQLPLISDLPYVKNMMQSEAVVLRASEGKSLQEKPDRFAFSIDDQDFFLIDAAKIELAEKQSNYKQENITDNQISKTIQSNEANCLQFHNLQSLRTLRPMWMAFAGITGSQLYRFYEKTAYCGRCGLTMIHSSTERAMTCQDCKNIIYPTISPAVIVAITKNDKILMTKYAGREFTNYALVAGFVEVGETLEQCVAREVKEEVGIEVTNIRYYKSQPWSFSDSLLAGFFAECSGSDEIFLDINELSIAEWIGREHIPPRVNDISLTQEMIEAFRNQIF